MRIMVPAPTKRADYNRKGLRYERDLTDTE